MASQRNIVYILCASVPVVTLALQLSLPCSDVTESSSKKFEECKKHIEKVKDAGFSDTEAKSDQLQRLRDLFAKQNHSLSETTVTGEVLERNDRAHTHTTRKAGPLIYGVGTSKTVWKQSLSSMTTSSNWQETSTGDVISIAISGDTIYGVGIENKVWKQSLSSMSTSSNWQETSKGDVISIAIAPNAPPTPEPTPVPTTVPTTPALTPAPTPNSNPIDLCSTEQEYNNLGSMGPNLITGVGAQSVIKFKHVTGPNSGVDMIIANTSTYTPDSVDSNGSPDGNCFGEINVKCGTSVQLRFSFTDTVTGAPIQLSRFEFTVADIDEGGDGKCKESIVVDGYEDYGMPTDTEIVKADDNGAKKFSATVHGTENDNPHDLTMTAVQEKRAVSFLFENIQSFTLTFATEDTGGWKGRKMSFAGKTSVSTQANYDNSI
jgi:hypothetical protein